MAQEDLNQYQNLRRPNLAFELLAKKYPDFSKLTVLTVCGGWGLEGSEFLNRGFQSVTVSDISEASLVDIKKADPRINTQALDAENLGIPDNSFDFVFVQDGLHHLPRPALGLTEMLRIARKGIIVIEPYLGLISKSFGSEYEHHEYGNSQSGVSNYVFRWNKDFFTQVIKSYFLKIVVDIKFIRLWHHNVIPRKLVLNNPLLKNKPVFWTKQIYRGLDTFLGPLGNNMVAVVLFDKTAS